MIIFSAGLKDELKPNEVMVEGDIILTEEEYNESVKQYVYFILFSISYTTLFDRLEFLYPCTFPNLSSLKVE